MEVMAATRPSSSLHGREENQPPFSASWDAFKEQVLSMIAGNLDGVDDMADLFLPSPHWDPLSPLYVIVRDFLLQRKDHLDELLILNLAGATAKSFFSKCCEELTLTSNNHGGDEEVRECDWRELYLEMLCLCIALEDAVPNLHVTDTFTTDHSSSPYTTLKSQACILLSEAMVAYPPAYHTLYSVQATSEGCDGDKEDSDRSVPVKRRLILRLASSCARLSLKIMLLLMNSSSSSDDVGAAAAAPPLLKRDEFCRCLSAVLPLTADFTVADTLDTAWARAESLLLPLHHQPVSPSIPLSHPVSVFIHRLPWNEMRDVSTNVVWPRQHEVVLPCSLMLLREARDVLRCVCDGLHDDLPAIANTHATELAKEFRRNMQMSKEIHPCDDDIPVNVERSLVLTGSKVLLENSFARRSGPEPAIAIGIALITEEACRCSSYCNGGRKASGFTDINAMGELLPVILPFADYWEPSIASLGLTSLLRVVFLATSTQAGWHRPLLLEYFGRALRVLRDEAAVSLAIAGVAAVLAAVPISEIGSARREAGSLLKEVCRQAVMATSESHRLVMCRGLCIILESPVFQCGFGLIPHIALVLGFLLPLLQLKVIPDSPSGHLIRLTALHCIHSLCVACWPRIPDHEMSIMSVLIGLCFELKKEKSTSSLVGNNNHVPGQCGGGAHCNANDTIYGYAIRVSALVHLLCSERINKDGHAIEERALDVISRRISNLQNTCKAIAEEIQHHFQ